MKTAHHSETAETRKGRSLPEGATALSPVAEIVRRHDRDRYQTALFAPSDRREALFALYAFNYEVARVRESVTQPMLGQIRLQWWREAVDAAYAGRSPRRHEVVEPLAAMIADIRPSRTLIDRLIEARERDLADDPPADRAALVDYCAGTSSALLRVALEVLGADDPEAGAAADDIGIGYALAGLVRAMPFHAAAGRCYIPADIAAQSGLDPDSYARRADTPALRNAVAELAETASRRLANARHRSGATPRRALPALLPAVIADRFLARLRRAGCNPFAPELAVADGLQAWRLAVAALRNRF